MRIATWAVDNFWRASGVVLDAVLPPLCLSCSIPTDAAGRLCASCWSKIIWLSAPLCTCCGAPFEFDPGARPDEELLCGACIRERPAFTRARAVFRYDDASRGLVLSYKHADRTHATPAYGRWLARAGAELLADCDVIAPVPLHWTRLVWRRYNQAALLALAVAREVGRPAIPDLLLRVRRTVTQGDLGRSARRRNVQRAFRLTPHREQHVAGQRILLVDDVLTTGATVEECARVLLRAGAASVAVLTLARVVRPS